MINNATIELGSFVYKKKRKLHRRIIAKSKRNFMLSLTISLGLIIITSFFISNNMYVYTNSKNLGFAVEYNFTSGFSSENKLLRVQKMSLVYCDEDTAIVEASGLSKKAPHKSTYIKGSFKKDSNQHWIFEKFILSD
ncbi:hypothetical protein [Clostridium sp.]|uniref:hypothetical protein n=1 Tax=Clostridium sp. TaxID=1506 RepID=UPI00283FF8D0|nr:hypothetical protein [Clostridium sp.]MDR3593946.1 hypothetical protein [Clostridium sp.]